MDLKSKGRDNYPDIVKTLVDNILHNCLEVLGGNLTGFYLHGSLAMNCFNPSSSDIDLLAVVKNKLTLEQKKAIIQYILKEYDKSPGKAVEISIILEEYLENFIYPTPFELHYSNDWYQRYRDGEVDYSAQNFDEDLAAHFVIIRNRGICLFGRPVKEVFPAIPAKFNAQSLLYDARCIYERFTNDPVYTVLNLCRILAFFEDKIITSKKEGGEWALLNLPEEFSSLISWALTVYSADEKDIQTDNITLTRFVEYTKSKLPL